MKILITGCNGQVGISLVNKLTGVVEFLAVDRESLDITDEQAVTRLVAEYNPDIIINAAAYTAVDRAESESELAFSVNRDGPKYLAKAAQKTGAVLLHISTDYVFSGGKAGEYSETDKTAPQSVYGRSKLEGESAVIGNCDRHIILRTAWVFSEYGNNFVKTMLRLGQDREALSIVGDQYGGPTYAGDIAEALIHISNVIHTKQEVNWGIYNFSGSPHVSWYDFAAEVFKKAAEHKVINRVPTLSNIPTSDYPTPASRPANSKLNCSKISREFNIVPSDWQQALNQIQDYK
ncbi:MAG: dTDP-4-dehydrorhamnose reductase [Aliivibrio sp.]|uniref:dTDP-4-dehydrorhamnose reductase n=1 Tax=Aliivibrio sp. TaxID=1872443 RepID=UPI001A4BD63D|nr:dTDP-4-dehydrorhamnose reductase [Aliivibrio sp.]